MASSDTIVSSDIAQDAQNGGQISENMTDSLQDQTENPKQMLSSEGRDLTEEGNKHENTSNNHKILEDENNEKNAAELNQATANGAIPKKSRRVYFIDDKIVSGYCDPPNPWNNASECSTEELVCAYQIACEKHGIKPIPKLLHQLKGITDFCDRNETLTLKGERIDYKHCDTFEEVLRRVQFRTFDLEGTHLEEEGAIALFDMIEYYESCTKLNLSFNKNIGIRGWQSCARMLKKTPCIEQLDARNTSLTEQVMPMLGRALRLGSQLTVLHLESAILSGRPLMILVTAIKMNEILRELYLADNKLMPSDGIQLGNMLKFNHKLALLDLRNNHLQDVGTSHLCDGLYEQSLGSGLNTLVLWNNQVTFQSMPSLARALTSTFSLETLNLGHNNMTNEGIHRLKEGLLFNKSLLRIGLQAAKITCEGAVALAEFIADSPRLLRIDLRENDIKTGGLMALSLSLKVSETVTRIDLDKEPKRESGMKDYADQQRRLMQDISNLMLRNRDLLRQREEEERQRKAHQRAQNTTSASGKSDGEAQGGNESKGAQSEAKPSESEAKCENEASEVKNENETETEVDLPEVVALDDVVPQLVVPKDGSTDVKEQEEMVKKEEGRQEMAAPAESPVKGENTKSETDPDLESSGEGFRRETLLGAARKGEQFHLDLPLTSGPATLESPAFIPENAIPVVVPPTEEEVARQVAERNASLLAASPEYNPVAFPPSPMVGAPRPITAALSPETRETVRTSPVSSPTARRKFIISRVQESASPLATKSASPDITTPSDITAASPDPPAKHSAETSRATSDGASGDSSFATSFQSPGNGNSGNSVSNSSCDEGLKGSETGEGQVGVKEPVSLTDDNSSAESSANLNKDLNENPTDRVSMTTATKETSQQQQPAIGGGTDGSETTDNKSAESATVKSNDVVAGENKTMEGVDKTTGLTDNSGSNDRNDNVPETLPDFHTNLSLNGMRSELANVIDSLEKSGKSVDKTAAAQTAQNVTTGYEDGGNDSPDDFEKELDELLANLPAAPAVLQQSKGEDQSVTKETVEQQS